MMNWSNFDVFEQKHCENRSVRCYDNRDLVYIRIMGDFERVRSRKIPQEGEDEEEDRIFDAFVLERCYPSFDRHFD